MKLQRSHGSVLVACPDSRPPAYQAVVGLHRTGKLARVRHSELL